MKMQEKLKPSHQSIRTEIQWTEKEKAVWESSKQKHCYETQKKEKQNVQ